MIQKQRIILDANILIRSILGSTYGILERYGDSCSFLTPQHCADETKKHLVLLLNKRGIDNKPALDALDSLFLIVKIIPSEAYDSYKHLALARIAHRDKDDWPLIAVAMLMDCPIWTEDADFFGVGIATWQTRNIEIYLSGG